MKISTEIKYLWPKALEGPTLFLILFSRALITIASVAHQIIGVSHHEVIVAHAMTVLDVVPRHHATIPRNTSPTTDSTIKPMHIKGLSMLLLQI